MAMSVEQMNQKLEKVLRDLDKAIEDRDATKVAQAMKSAREFNQASEGEKNSEILEKMEERITKISQDLHPNQGLDINDRKELVKIRKKINEGKNPFQKIEKVVNQLAKEDISQRDFKSYKEQQKEDNLISIDAIKEKNKLLASVIIDIEMKYIEQIEKNNQSMEILKEIGEKRDFIKDLDEKNTIDAETIKAEKAGIKTLISKLASKGMDVSQIENFETNFDQLNDIEGLSGNYGNKNKELVKQFKKDKTIPEEIKVQFDLDNVDGSDHIKWRYQQMLSQKRKYISKINTLQAENEQIDKTIATLNREEKDKSIAYHDDGSAKSNAEIASTVLRDEVLQRNVEERVADKYKFNEGKWKRFLARMDYYKQEKGKGRLGAFWNAIKNRKQFKALVTGTEAVNYGREMSNVAQLTMKTRQEEFRATMKNEVRKAITRDTDAKEDQIKEEAMSKAYKSTLGEVKEEERDI